MEIRVNISDEYLKLAASTLAFAVDDKSSEDMILSAADEFKGEVIELCPEKDFSRSEAKKISLALGMFALGKIIAEKKNAKTVSEKGC